MSSRNAPSERRLVADAVAIRDRRRALLAPTSFSLATGEVLVVAGDPGHGHTALALALAGRLAGHSGTVTLDGSPDRAARQAAVALVDVPGVSEPHDNVPLTTVVGEELAMARRPAGRRAVLRWLDEQGLGSHVGDRMEDLHATSRVGALARLASLRPAVRFLVLVLPERAGDLPDGWLPVAHELAAEGFGVLVTATTGTARQLPEDVVALGAHTHHPGTQQPHQEERTDDVDQDGPDGADPAQ